MIVSVLSNIPWRFDVLLFFCFNIFIGTFEYSKNTYKEAQQKHMMEKNTFVLVYGNSNSTIRQLKCNLMSKVTLDDKWENNKKIKEKGIECIFLVQYQ